MPYEKTLEMNELLVDFLILYKAWTHCFNLIISFCGIYYCTSILFRVILCDWYWNIVKRLALLLISLLKI